MDLDLINQDLRQDKIIENLFNVIRPVGNSTHYFQQACIINLLVTVFAARHLENFFRTDIFLTLTNCSNGRPTRKELTAGPHDHGANTAP
jgi:hypothetical protein